MNYLISLYETFDGNGIGIISLVVEIDGQIYRSTGRYMHNKDKNKAIRKCFKEISEMLKEK